MFVKPKHHRYSHIKTHIVLKSAMTCYDMALKSTMTGTGLCRGIKKNVQHDSTGAGPPLEAWAGLPLETRAWAGLPLKAGAWAGLPLEAGTGAAPLLEGTPGSGPPLETEARVARHWSPGLGPAHRRKQNWGRFATGGLDWSATVARDWGWSIVLSA